LDIAKLNQ